VIASSYQKLSIAGLPLIGSIALIFGVLGIAQGAEFESAPLEALGGAIILLVSLMVAGVSARSFLVTGSVNLLLLGLAVFQFGLSALLAGLILSVNPNESGVIFILGAFVSSCFHLASGVLTYRGSLVERTRLRLRLWVSFLGATGFILLLTLLVLDSSVLTRIGQIGAFSQRIFMRTTVVMLLSAGVLLARVYSRTHSPVLFRYSLALGTAAMGCFSFFATQNSGDVATWAGLGGLCLASVYLLKSVYSSSKRVGTSANQAGSLVT
jgi:hypothetical protein